MIGPPRDPTECDAFAALCHEAFGLPPLDEHDWLTRLDPARVRLIRDAARVVGGLALVPMGMWLGGARVAATAVHLVVVAPDLQGQGIGRSLLAHALAELHGAGVGLAVLHPDRTGLYHHAGFAEAGTCVRYGLRPELLAPSATDGLHLESVVRTEHASLGAAYRERARATSGNLDRGPWAWRRVFDPGGRAAEVVRACTTDGATAGYIVIQRSDEDLHLRDLVALTPACEQRLLAYVAARFRNVEWNGPPGAAGGEPLRAKHWFARVCDVRTALTSRGYPPDVRATLDLDIVDDQLPANGGHWQLAIAGGAAQLTRGGDGTHRLDIRALAAAVTGHHVPAPLADVFAGPAPWMPDQF